MWRDPLLFVLWKLYTSVIIYSTYDDQTASELRAQRCLSLKHQRLCIFNPTLALHPATWCIACLIRLVQANPTVTNCALLFTLITPSEEVDLYWARLRFTSGSQRSPLSKVKTSHLNTHPHPHPASPHQPLFTQQLNLNFLYLYSLQKILIRNNVKVRLSLEMWVNMHIRSPVVGLWPVHVSLSVESTGMRGMPSQQSQADVAKGCEQEESRVKRVNRASRPD